MNSVNLITSIEEAFADLDRPSIEQMGGYVERQFLDGVGSRAWQELRPLRQFIGGGGDIVQLSAKAYQYYLPAYLVALIDEPAEEYYLNGVLDSVWYGSDRSKASRFLRDYFDPRKGLTETLRELETQMPELTDQERRSATETRVSVAKKLVLMKELTGHDFLDGSQYRDRLRTLWEERIPLLTESQRRCVARILVLVRARTKDRLDAPRIQAALDGYWSAFLDQPPVRPNGT